MYEREFPPIRGIGVSIRLHPQCSERIRAHVGYPAGDRTTVTPELANFTAEVLDSRDDAEGTEPEEAQWRALTWAEKHRHLIELEEKLHTPYRNTSDFRFATSTTVPAADIFSGTLGYLGIAAGWELHNLKPKGDVPSSWTEEELRQDGPSLSTFVRAACYRYGRSIDLHLYIPDEALRPQTNEAMLTFILDSGQAAPGHRDGQDKQGPNAGGTGDLGRLPDFEDADKKRKYSGTCMLDPFADVWEPSHVIPRTVSPHTFKTIIATIGRCFKHAEGRLAKGSYDILEYAASMREGDLHNSAQAAFDGPHSSKLSSNRNNNMLPLQPHMRKLFERRDICVGPMSCVPIWTGRGKMPANLLLGAARGYEKGPLVDYLTGRWSGRSRSAARPAVFTNASFVLFSVMATPNLKMRLKERASKVVVLRSMGTLPRAAKAVKRRRRVADEEEEEGGGDAELGRTGEDSPKATLGESAAQGPSSAGNQTGDSNQGAPQAAGSNTSSADKPTTSDKTTTPSTGDAFDSWWIQHGGSPEQRDLRQAAVELITFAHFLDSFEKLVDWWNVHADLQKRLSGDLFGTIYGLLKTSLELKAGTWRPEPCGPDERNTYNKKELAQFERARKRAVPRILQIVGLDEKGKNTKKALLDRAKFAELMLAREEACFYTWWPVVLAGETEGLDRRYAEVSDARKQ